MPVFHSLEQGALDWLYFRRSRVSASKIGIIMGLSPWRSQYMQWCEDVGLSEPQEQTAAMKRGSLMEPDALREYCLMRGVEMKPAVVTHSEYPDFMASLDGINDDHTKIVEIKCPGQKGHEESRNGDVKPLYKCQVLWQMFCTGLSQCDYFSYDGENGYIIEIDRDDKLIEEMVIKAKEYLEFVRTLIPPPFTDLDYIDKSGDARLESLLLAYDRAVFNRKGAEALEKDLKDQIVVYCDNTNTKTQYGKITKVTTKGRIDYSKIEVLKEIDLEKYRGNDIVSYRITVN